MSHLWQDFFLVTMATLTKKDLLEAIEDMPMDAKIDKAVVKDGVVYHYHILRIKCNKKENTITIC